MVTLSDLQRYLADLLNTVAYTDYCVNGVQVEGRRQIGRTLTGVSVSERLFRAAVEKKADAVIVHHGLFWQNTPTPMALTGFLKARVKLLLESDISLLAYHLPLDGHPELGNNALIARALGLKDVALVPIKGNSTPIAAVGLLPRSQLFASFVKSADRIFGSYGMAQQLALPRVHKVFVLSGGGSGYFPDAVQAGADVMVTGEIREDAVRAAEESGLNLYAAGHYNSEKWGIRALGEHLKATFKLEVTFVDIPNPV